MRNPFSVPLPALVEPDQLRELYFLSHRRNMAFSLVAYALGLVIILAMEAAVTMAVVQFVLLILTTVIYSRATLDNHRFYVRCFTMLNLVATAFIVLSSEFYGYAALFLPTTLLGIYAEESVVHRRRVWGLYSAVAALTVLGRAFVEPVPGAPDEVVEALLAAGFAVGYSGLVMHHFTKLSLLGNRSIRVRNKEVNEELQAAEQLRSELQHREADLLRIAEQSRQKLASSRLQSIELQASAQHRRSFVQGIVHDLQAPAKGVKDCLDLLVTPFQQDESEYFTLMQANSRVMTVMLAKLVRYFQLEERASHVQEVEVLTLTRRLCSQSRDRSLEGRLQVFYEDSRPSTLVWGDEQLLSELVTEVIDNAITFAKPNEPASLRVEFGSESAASLRTIRFIDDGIGLAPEYHQQACGLFRRCHDRSSYSGAGSGVGLAIAKRAAQRLNGSLELSGEHGGGLTVSLTLPTKAPISLVN